MIKLSIALSLISCQVFAVTIISERFWCTGDVKCAIDRLANDFPDFNSSTSTFLLDQYGFQGMENKIGSSHSFYIYNTSGIPETHIVQAKLCDTRGNCANFERTVKIDWHQLYNDHINLTLTSSSSDVGYEPIYAYTDIYYDPEFHSSKNAKLFLQPFPYDVKK